ncbi:MAG TPA: phosphoadenylyl-sulfate reductase [Aggregatilineales bacterium]|nr:phosphoadenylyl-sulfate reductase [Anaerolineales bacterium]HRE47863.1 phosphoadenylyl-sulfate reductase [Aggregatilineales bacterium]
MTQPTPNTSDTVATGALVETLNARFADAHPAEILRWAVGEFGQRLATVTSFQPTGIVTLHMLSEFAPNTPVLTLDTGLLFSETYALMNDLEKRLALNLLRLRPAQTVAEQAATHGEALWLRDPDQCCALRKTDLLDRVLGGYGAWLTGLRRDQSEGRAETPIFAWDRKHNNLKIAPFATWTESMVWTYLHAYELPYNTLHDQGYPSIGCYPCTRAVDPASGDKRAGRWAGSAKTECGIHIDKTISEETNTKGQHES